MKKILLLIFVFSICVSKAQYYTQSVPVDTVIYTGSYSFPGVSCNSMEFPDITLDPTLYSYVDGLEFIMLVDSVNFAGPIQFSPVHVGDTIKLNSVNSVYYTPAPVIFHFKLKLVGVPTTAGQNYPCHLDFLMCTCNCYHMIIKPSISNTAMCSVGLLNSVKQINQLTSFSIYPNPVVHKLTISGINSATVIKLYNSCGSLVLEQNIDKDVTIDTDTLLDGIYTLYISSNENSNGITKKIAINSK